MIRLAFLASSLALLWVLASGAALGGSRPSFDCSQSLSDVEKLVCSNAELAAADAAMGKLYALARTSAFGRGASNQLAAQNDWLASRAGCMTMGATKSEPGTRYGPLECVADRYRQRNRELAVAILLSHPDAAIGVLRKDSPQIAPLYEALQLHVTKPQSAKWSDAAYRDTGKKVAALLQPYYADLKKDADKDYGLSVLSDIAVSPEAAMASDAKLASAISIISVYVTNDEGAASFPFPCAAIIKRPEMISAAGPYFGSTLDNFLPQLDCEQSLPAQPRLDALAKALNGFWVGDCGGGTIRFAYYRSYAQLEDSARMGLPVERQKGGNSRLTRKGLEPKLVNAAIAELADQYARYNGLSKPEAEKRARFWLGRMIADAGGCDS